MNHSDDEHASELSALREFLSRCRPGKISGVDELVTVLAQCWDQFDGAAQEGMAADKLDRVEDVEWDPPKLRFQIERHGGTVKSSSRAELQRWTVNLDTQHATVVKNGYRSVRPMQPRLDVALLADEISRLIVEHKKNSQLKWSNENEVKILIGKIIPEDSAVKQTVAGRRKRFRKCLEQRLSPHGWIELRANSYIRA